MDMLGFRRRWGVSCWAFACLYMRLEKYIRKMEISMCARQSSAFSSSSSSRSSSLMHQEDDTLLGVTWLNWVCLAALGILANMPRHANSAKY